MATITGKTSYSQPMTPIRLEKRKFLRWLAKQPNGRKFDYLDVHDCLIASFMKETYAIKVLCGSDGITLSTNSPMDWKNRRKFTAFFNRLNTAIVTLRTEFTVADVRKALAA